VKRIRVFFRCNVCEHEYSGYFELDSQQVKFQCICQTWYDATSGEDADGTPTVVIVRMK